MIEQHCWHWSVYKHKGRYYRVCGKCYLFAWQADKKCNYDLIQCSLKHIGLHPVRGDAQ